MAKNVRAKMVTGAREMISQRGPRATSFADVVEATGTPRGSIYHHFPGGKQEMVLAAIDEQEEIFSHVIGGLSGSSAPELITRLFQTCTEQVKRSNYSMGCPATATVVTAENDEQVERGGQFFTSVVDLVTKELVTHGLSSTDAREYATLCLASMGGAITLARASRSVEPLDAVLRELLRHPHLRAAAAVR